MRFLSSRRRHPAAKALLLVAGLFVMGALYTACSPRPAGRRPTPEHNQQIAEGKALFAVGCASCHGLNGEGQVNEHDPGSAAGRRRRRGGRVPGEHRSDADGQARTRRPRSSPTATPRKSRRPRRVRRLARPRPGHPGPGPVRPGDLSARGSGPRRRAVPDQLLGLPQLRGRRRRTAQRQVRPVADRRLQPSTCTRR